MKMNHVFRELACSNLTTTALFYVETIAAKRTDMNSEWSRESFFVHADWLLTEKFPGESEIPYRIANRKIHAISKYT